MDASSNLPIQNCLRLDVGHQVARWYGVGAGLRTAVPMETHFSLFAGPFQEFCELLRIVRAQSLVHLSVERLVRLVPGGVLCVVRATFAPCRP